MHLSATALLVAGKQSEGFLRRYAKKIYLINCAKMDSRRLKITYK